MAIFDEKKMEQKPVYPTKRTPSYADWALFRMGKELEESVSGGTQYTAGYGIDITNNIISTISDYKFVKIETKEFLLDKDEDLLTETLETLSEEYLSKDILVIVDTVSSSMYAGNMHYTNSVVIESLVRNSSEDSNCSITYIVYAKEKEANRDNIVTVIGQIGDNYNGVPYSTSADANKILTVDANGEPNWSTPLTPQVTVDQTVIAGSTNPVAGGGVKTYVDTEVAGINEVPASTSADANKVLTVDSNGDANWAQPSTPQITVDQTVIAGSTNPVAGGGVKTYVDTEIAYINEVPGSIASDSGKVLTVNSNGNAEWQTPSGGSGITKHSYSTFGELATAIINNPSALIHCVGHGILDYNILNNSVCLNGVNFYSNASSSLKVGSAAFDTPYFDSTSTATSLKANEGYARAGKGGTTSSDHYPVYTLSISSIYLYY